ncbi:MAG: hypothetical protein QHJ82_10665 [Verrucomicrobiota bacterium]|nr:hypothetical protein [Verrucomicrobiota bacterium]
MTLLKAEGDRYQFGMSLAEKTVLLVLLDRYPTIPLSYYKLSKTPGGDKEDDQAVLEEAMSSRRSLLKRRVTQLMHGEDRFQQGQNQLHVTFTRDEIEWLLQVLNDIRVGSWIRLGCPDCEKRMPVMTTGEDKLSFAEMELAAHFECMFLEAVDGHVT